MTTTTTIVPSHPKISLLVVIIVICCYVQYQLHSYYTIRSNNYNYNEVDDILIDTITNNDERLRKFLTTTNTTTTNNNNKDVEDRINTNNKNNENIDSNLNRMQLVENNDVQDIGQKMIKYENNKDNSNNNTDNNNNNNNFISLVERNDNQNNDETTSTSFTFTTRAYPYWHQHPDRIQLQQQQQQPHHDLPCYRPTLFRTMNVSLWTNPQLNLIRKVPITEGLLFVKLYKTASTTAASIHLRIARNLANRIHNSKLVSSSETSTNYTNENIIQDNNENDDEQQKRKILIPTSTGYRSRYYRRKLVGMKQKALLAKIMQQYESSLKSDTNASSSSSAINWDDQYWPLCRTRHYHGSASYVYKFGDRNITQSVLWSMIRQPTKRYLSEFYHFIVSRSVARNNRSKYYEEEEEDGEEEERRNIATDMIHYLQQGKNANHHYIHMLSLQKYRYQRLRGPHHPRIRTAIQNILNQYDFIGIMERFDESIVVLMLLLGIPMTDILYISSKLNGGWDYYVGGNNINNQCVAILPTVIPPAVHEYLNSTEWKNYIEPENTLYELANRNLDLTINSTIGYTKFQATLQKFKYAQQRVVELCHFNNVPTAYPCNPINGTTILTNDCLQGDMGCGFTCLDQVATELNLW